MAYIQESKTWKVDVVSGGINYYGLLEYNYSAGTFTLTPTDNLYVPLTITTVTDGYTHLLAEAKVIIAAEVANLSPTVEQDLSDRIGYINSTVNIDFISSAPAVVWTIGELTEPEHYQAIQALILKYLNQLSNYPN